MAELQERVECCEDPWHAVNSGRRKRSPGELPMLSRKCSQSWPHVWRKKRRRESRKANPRPGRTSGEKSGAEKAGRLTPSTAKVRCRKRQEDCSLLFALLLALAALTLALALALALLLRRVVIIVVVVVVILIVLIVI